MNPGNESNSYTPRPGEPIEQARQRQLANLRPLPISIDKAKIRAELESSTIHGEAPESRSKRIRRAIKWAGRLAIYQGKINKANLAHVSGTVPGETRLVGNLALYGAVLNASGMPIGDYVDLADKARQSDQPIEDVRRLREGVRGRLFQWKYRRAERKLADYTTGIVPVREIEAQQQSLLQLRIEQSQRLSNAGLVEKFGFHIIGKAKWGLESAERRGTEVNKQDYLSDQVKAFMPVSYSVAPPYHRKNETYYAVNFEREDGTSWRLGVGKTRIAHGELITMPVKGFSDLDVSIVENMVNEIEDLRLNGELPDLTSKWTFPEDTAKG